MDGDDFNLILDVSLSFLGHMLCLLTNVPARPRSREKCDSGRVQVAPDQADLAPQWSRGRGRLYL